jgi:hypothetical protein
MLQTLRRPRRIVTAAVVAAAALVLGFAAQPAHAAINRDRCGYYVYAYSYWMEEFSQESLRTQGEYSDYLGFAGRMANDYQEMFVDDGC